MAENNTDRMGGLMNVLLSNPALIQGALSLLSGKGDPSGGPDLSAILGALGGGGPSGKEEARESEHGQDTSKASGDFDLEAFLSTLSSDDKTAFAENTESTNTAEESASALPVSIPERPPHHQSDTELLLALRPYLSRERRAIIDNIVRISQLMETVRSVNTKGGPS